VVVVHLDHLLAVSAGIETRTKSAWVNVDGETVMHSPSEADATTMSDLVTENTCGCNIVWLEQLGEIMLVHVLRQVGDVEVRVVLVRESLELGVERLLQCTVSSVLGW
jgi:hypothetical protein